MGVPTSEVGYSSAMRRREDHEVRKGHEGHWIKKKSFLYNDTTKLRIWYKYTTLWKWLLEVHFYQLFPYLQKNTDFLKIPRLRKFVLVVSATYRWRLVWITGGMYWPGKTEALRATCTSATSAITNRTWSGRGYNPSLRDERRATNRPSYGMALFETVVLLMKCKSSVHTSQRTQRMSFINTSQLYYLGKKCVFIVRIIIST